jgi:GT2 family glycosyltransferase
MNKPLVSIIIVNYNGRYLLDDCLSSLQKTNFPKDKFEIIVVDNNSQDDSVAYIKKYFPEAKLVEAQENLGFTGGNNLGLEHASGKYIALLNSDTRVTPNWLIEMLKSALDPKVGIVAPKLYYDLPFLELTIHSNIVNKSDLDGSGDFSPLGTLIEDIECKNTELSGQIWYKSGFYKKKKGDVAARWTKDQAKVLIPFDRERSNEYSFTFHGYKVSSDKDNLIKLKLGEKTIFKTILKPGEVKQCAIKISQSQVQSHFKYLIQNAGNIILKDGHGKDRGGVLRIKNKKNYEFYDLDKDYYNKPQKLLAFCGAGCLIKRKLIDHVGFFDGFYFMYYEDLDLSLRAWKNGWDIVYTPKAVIYHKHRATTGVADSSFFINLIERNHLSFLLTHFPPIVFFIEFLLFLTRTIFSLLSAILYKFTNNLRTADIWESRAEARTQALKFILTNFIRIYKKRLFWQKREVRNYKKLEKFLY